MDLRYILKVEIKGFISVFDVKYEGMRGVKVFGLSNWVDSRIIYWDLEGIVGEYWRVFFSFLLF